MARLRVCAVPAAVRMAAFPQLRPTPSWSRNDPFTSTPAGQIAQIPAIPDRVVKSKRSRHEASGMVGIFEALSTSVYGPMKAPKSTLPPAFSVSTAGSALTLLEAAQIALADHGLRFDFD
jgi:hypothetical protein